MAAKPLRRPRGRGAVLHAVALAALIGLVVTAVATAVHLHVLAEGSMTSRASSAHTSYPLLWFIYFAPLTLAGTGALYVLARLRRARLEANERRSSVDVLMAMARHAVVVGDARDRIVEWSAGAEELLGHPAADILGQPLSRLIAPSDVGAFEAQIASARSEDGRPGLPHVLQGRRCDGSELALEISLATWQTSSGQQLGAVLRDISKQVLAERRVGEVEKNWRNIAMNSSDVLLLLDRAGTIVFANRGLLGLAPDDVIGQGLSELVPELADVVAKGLRCVFESGEAHQHEGRVASADGQAHWWWCRFAPQREDSEVARAVLSISDIGDRVERDLAVQRLAGIVERTRDAVLATDAKGKILIWNSGAELLWGYGATEIIGQHLGVLCPPDLLEEQAAIFARLRDGRHVNPYDTFGLAKNRRRLPVSVSVTATRDDAGRFDGVSAVVRDMTHHLELQDALQQARRVAETASQLKSEFLANMSHEVRTPLNGVVGMADLLRTTELTPEQEDYVMTLLEASRALRVIVDDVLDFSKIEAGRIEIENVEFDLRALAKSSVEMFRSAAEENDTALRMVLPARSPLRVLGDPNRIRQVLTNLVGNAVKFTKGGGVEVGMTLKDGGNARLGVRFVVEDTGVGISPEAQARIFQPFAQADGSITRRFGGTGLGLSICRKLLDRMGGDIGFSSAVGVGSSFWFELTLVEAKSSGSRRRTARPVALPKGDARWRVLVAEDNAVNQKVVSAMLRNLGHHADIAQNGREALERWKHGGYDLILMDCQMPVMSGFEAAAAIRQQESGSGARVPIVAMTAQAYAQDRVRCLQAGMDGHVAKPLTIGELDSALSQWLPGATPSLLADPAPSLIASSQAASVDIQQLERLQSELGEGGREMVTDLIETFVTDFQQALERLDMAAKAAAWQPVAAEAHRLRSSTANLAATELSLLCARLEGCAEGKARGSASELIQLLREEFPRVQAALAAHVRRAPPRLPNEARDPTSLPAASETNRVSS